MTRAAELNHAVDTMAFLVRLGEYGIEDMRAIVELALRKAEANAGEDADATVCFNCSHKPQIECENNHSPLNGRVCRLGDTCHDWEARDRIAEAEELAETMPLPPASLNSICFNCRYKPRMICVGPHSPHRGYPVGALGTCNTWEASNR